MKKVCIITAARSEYGVLRWIIDAVHLDPELEMQLVVTGSHLSPAFGQTGAEIEKDGYPIAMKADMLLDSETQFGIVKSMGRCLDKMADVFLTLKPDLVVVLGDRYELLPICSAALIMKIPIAHISGGDVTTGAIDNEIRNAVSMMASLHFPGVKESADNIARMRNSSENIQAVGEPGLDNLKKLKLMDREGLAGCLGLHVHRKWLLVTLHPETQASLSYNLEMADHVWCLLESIPNSDVVISKANADFGGHQINACWERWVARDSNKYHLHSSLGQLRYLSLMNECDCVIGNSSSGIIESPCLGVPVLNIGNRQKGRHLCRNVISVSNQWEAIEQGWRTIEHNPCRLVDTYYGDGHSAERIVSGIKVFLNKRG